MISEGPLLPVVRTSIDVAGLLPGTVIIWLASSSLRKFWSLSFNNEIVLFNRRRPDYKKAKIYLYQLYAYFNQHTF